MKAQIHRVLDEDDVAVLVAHLTGRERSHPVVVVTAPPGRGLPFVLVDELADEVGDLADVHLILDPRSARVFSDLMPERTAVYGGSGRVYPVGRAWVGDPTLAPLRFAADPLQGRAATRYLAADTTALASAAGLLDPAGRVRSRRGGEVKGVSHDTRALIRLDGGALATVVPELAVPGEPLERVLAPGQRVEGWWDAETGRLDVRDSVRSAPGALAGYTSGVIVTARVVAVEHDHARLALHPHVLVDVARDEVTSNDRDDLRSLMTPGEVLGARVLRVGPAWALGLLDVDDDDVPLPAPPLLPGGPPWLELPPEDAEPSPATAQHPNGDEDAGPPPVGRTRVAPPASPAGPALAPHLRIARAPRSGTPSGRPSRPAEAGPAERPAEERPAEEGRAEEGRAKEGRAEEGRAEEGRAEEGRAGRAGAPAPGPSPRLLDPRYRAAPDTPEPPTPPFPPRSAASPREPDPRPAPLRSAALSDMTLTIEALRQRLRAADATVANLTEERDHLHALVDQHERDDAQSEDQLTRLRKQLRKARRRPGPAGAAPAVRFADAEQGFRYAVLGAWARRTPLGSQADQPLPDYDVGPRFLDSLASLEGVSERKVVDVVVEVVTGVADRSAGREVHQLRRGSAGSGYLRRDGDDATCWRAALQIGAPQARRLHFWRLPGGRVELCRVVRHDDVEP